MKTPPTPLQPPTLGGRLAAACAWSLVRFTSACTRWELPPQPPEVVQNRFQRVIFAFWHNRQIVGPEIYRRYFAAVLPDRRLASIASASRDGAIAARFLELSGAVAARGSSSRRGARALVELISLARQGHDLAVTPDGPRGPRYEVKPGVIALAQHTGLPIVPISCTLTRKLVLKSWDGFQIPLPFGRGTVVTAATLPVPAELDEAGRLELARELQARMMGITRD